MPNIRHAFVVPLIGGMAIGQSEAFGSRPLFMQSYGAFAKNDQHIRAWWPEVPFEVLDEAPEEGHRSVAEAVDVVGMTPPCAGLSAMSPISSADSAINDWMLRASEHALKNLRPRVAWAENAPALSSAKGRPVAEKLKALGDEHGYSFSMYRTKSQLHGNPQVRQRTFFFFWKERNAVPVLPWIKRPPVTIEEFMNTPRPQDDLSQKFLDTKRPSDMPVYRYTLDRAGCDHATFVRDKLESTIALSALYMRNGGVDGVIAYLDGRGLDREAKRIRFWKKKFEMGAGVIDRYLILPKGAIGAFVGQCLWVMAHPFKDRYLNLREMADLMGMPVDFTWIDPIKNSNHLAQNVPVGTAKDVAGFIKAYLEGELEMMPTQKKIITFDNMTQRIVSGDKRVEPAQRGFF